MSEQWKRSTAKFLNPKLLLNMIDATYMLNFWTFRYRFCKANGLDDKFQFSLYLKRRIQRLFIELIEVNWRVWVLICVGALVDYARLIYGDTNVIHDTDVFVFIGLWGGGSLAGFLFVCYTYSTHPYFKLWLWLRIASSVYVNMYTIGIEDHVGKMDLEHTSDDALAKQIDESHHSNNAELEEQLAKPDEHKHHDEKEHVTVQHEEHHASPTTKAPIHNFFILCSPLTTFCLLQLVLVVQCVCVTDHFSSFCSFTLLDLLFIGNRYLWKLDSSLGRILVLSKFW